MVMGFNCLCMTIVRCTGCLVYKSKNKESALASLSFYKVTQSLFQHLYNRECLQDGGTCAKIPNAFITGVLLIRVIIGLQ